MWGESEKGSASGIQVAERQALAATTVQERKVTTTSRCNTDRCQCRIACSPLSPSAATTLSSRETHGDSEIGPTSDPPSRQPEAIIAATVPTPHSLTERPESEVKPTWSVIQLELSHGRYDVGLPLLYITGNASRRMCQYHLNLNVSANLQCNVVRPSVSTFIPTCNKS